MKTIRTIVLSALVVASLAACSESGGEATPAPAATQLYMDVHDLGAGNVTAEAVAKAHVADLSVQERHGVHFLHYWVDEQQGKVYCLSRAPDAASIVATHREAHGLLPTTVGPVSDGE
jgi:hypothetical protein